jgi:hypothetical protein
MIKLKISLLSLFLLITPLAKAINFVQVSENENMKVFLDIDSIEWNGNIVSTNEIREYKITMDAGTIGSYRSSLGLAEIDCKKNTSTIRFIDTYELNSLKGKLVSHGVKQPMAHEIKPKTMTSDVRDFLCSKRSLVKT